jgi:hypothetical protein
MWREKIQSLTKEAVFKERANEQTLADLESKLEVSLPDELKTLLLESDGVDGEYGLGLVWPSKRILLDNQNFRSNQNFADLYMSFNSLLFFADAGNGDQFAFAIRNGQIRSSDVYVWNHENDSRNWVAPSLEKYLTWWLDGSIEI